MTYSCSDFAMDIENICRAHGFKGEDLEELHVWLRERIPPKKQQVYAWMTESFDHGQWMTGFIGANFPGLGSHMPLVMRNEVIARSMKSVALAHGQRTNQTVWFRNFTHYIDEDAIHLRPEGTMPK